MVRSAILIASVLFAASATARAQDHDRTHPQGRPHDQSSHQPIDPEQHAAMHALLGAWTGTMTSPDHLAKLRLSATTDAKGALALTLASDGVMQVGTSSGVALKGDTLRWTQAVGDTSCDASAALAHGKGKPDVLNGTMRCGGASTTFALTRATK